MTVPNGLFVVVRHVGPLPPSVEAAVLAHRAAAYVATGVLPAWMALDVDTIQHAPADELRAVARRLGEVAQADAPRAANRLLVGAGLLAG